MNRKYASISLVVGLLAMAGSALGGDHQPFAARAGLDLASEAARIWAADADLVYVENDEALTMDGTAARWGYLFFSESRGQARGYTIRDGIILEAADLGFELDAPPLTLDWVDSGVALASAEKKAGREYRTAFDGRLESMLLIRGAFHEGDPDASTWALVYTADGEPALTVVVNAADGKVVRKWKG